VHGRSLGTLLPDQVVAPSEQPYKPSDNGKTGVDSLAGRHVSLAAFSSSEKQVSHDRILALEFFEGTDSCVRNSAA